MGWSPPLQGGNSGGFDSHEVHHICVAQLGRAAPVGMGQVDGSIPSVELKDKGFFNALILLEKKLDLALGVQDVGNARTLF